ncbi:MAG: hypothetical protein AAF570_07430 [Bacteroidota bacterium]
MFDNVPIERRLKVILGFIGFAFIISLLYGKQVMGIYAKVNELEQKTALVKDADLEIVQRQVKLKSLGQEIQAVQQVGKELSSHIELMEYVDSLCLDYGLELIRLPEEEIQEVGGYSVAHARFSVTGTYRDIVGLLFHLETKDRIGSVAYANVERQTIRVRNVRREMLVATFGINRLINERKRNG